jgi:L-fuconate dehydratase
MRITGSTPSRPRGVQHLAIFNHVAISATLKDLVCELVGQRHEHFAGPCVVEDARYLCPTVPGCSITMKPESLDEFEFPGGRAWKA